MKNRYTYDFTRSSTGTVTVTAASQEEADTLAMEQLEVLANDLASNYDEDTAEAELDFKNVEPYTLDDRDDDHA